MACFVATLGVIILSGSINLSAANKDTCDIYAAVGLQSLPLPFVYDKLSNSHVLRWTHNSKIIFYRQQGRVSVGKPEHISATGSLLLKNIKFSNAGAYKADVLDSNGTLAKSWTGRLCVVDKVSKPQVTYSCDFKSSAVNLNCHVDKPEGLVFSWTLDGNTLTSETKQKLSISLAQLKKEMNFTCSAVNKVSKETSDAVRLTCKSPSPPALLCYTSKTVVAVLAGGTGLILLLLTIIIVLCCRHSSNKTQKRLWDKGEFRMLSRSKRDPDSASPQYETMHPTEDCYESICHPEAQTENKTPQPSTAAEGHQPSPVPKPRTKSPQTANI